MASAAFAAAPGAARAAALAPAAVTLGNEVLLRDRADELRGRRIGLVTNQTGVTSQLVPLPDALHAHGGFDVRALYAPEHGLRGDRPAGAYVASYVDARTHLPVFSLYGPTKRPSAAMLADVDVLLFDIQDVGSRAYTFTSTLAEVMIAAHDHDREIWVLDRPNPIGGLVEGPVLEPAYSSFIGLYPIAMRHGMTIGELARMFNGRFGIGAHLEVVPMRGYRRSMLWPQTGLVWVQSSPNIPTAKTALFYVGTGLIDAAGVNNGVGTTKPFAYAGALGLDGIALAARINARNVPGLFARAAAWSPLFGAERGRAFSGIELVAADPAQLRSVRAAVEILAAVRDLAPHVIAIERREFDVDWGTDTVRRMLAGGASADDMLAALEPQASAFTAERAPYMLYD